MEATPPLAEFSKTIAETDVYLYAGITGDFNEIHIDATRAAASRFGKRVVHGTLLLGLVSKVLGMDFPGRGTILAGISARYLAPTFLGDTITVRLIKAEPRGKLLAIAFECHNQDGTTVTTGEATVLPPEAGR